MGLRINTNVASINAQRNLRLANANIGNTMERLSSGYRINRAGDDAAGLAISENLKAQIRGYEMNKRNSEDGISLIQVAEGGLAETTNILTRMRELAIQAASDTIGESERSFTNIEFQNLVQEVDRISKSTEFNKTKLLAGEDRVFDIQVGIRNDEFLDRIRFDAKSSDARAQTLGLTELNIGAKEGAQLSLANIDNAIQKVAGIRANFGALQNRLQSTISNLGVSVENLSSANSRMRDADMAYEMANLTRFNIMTQAGTAVLSQANQTSSTALKLLNG